MQAMQAMDEIRMKVENERSTKTEPKTEPKINQFIPSGQPTKQDETIMDIFYGFISNKSAVIKNRVDTFNDLDLSQHINVVRGDVEELIGYFNDNKLFKNFTSNN